MKKKRKKLVGRKLLSFVLTLVMVLSTMTGIVPGMSMTAQAASPYEGIINTTNAVKFAGQDWYLIEYDENENTVTLFLKDVFAESKYGSNTTYSGSTIEGVVNVWYEEKIPTDYREAVSGGMFLLTKDQANNIDVEVRKCSYQSPQGAGYSMYWLDQAVFVNNNTGRIAPRSVGPNEYTLGVRPALKLDLSKVTFDSNNKTFSVGSPKTNQTVTPPTAASELTYTGEEQALLTEGASVSEGKGNTEATIQYSLTPTDENSWVDSYTAVKAKNAKEYKVYYRVAGNDTYADFVSSDEQAVSVTIAKADPETPTGITAKYGDDTGKINLPEGWTWSDYHYFQTVGTDTVKANFAGNDNYNAMTGVDITVEVGKADIAISYEKTEVSVELNAEFGKNEITNLGDAEPTFKSSNESVATVSNTGYVTIKGIGETTITATIEDSAHYHYTTTEASYKLTVNPITTRVNTAPTAAELTYGQKLSESTLTGGEAVGHGSSVAGNFAWKEPNLVPNASDDGQYAVVFTPDDANYAKSTCNVKVKVKKAPAPVTKESLSPGQKPAAKNADELVYTGEPIELVKAPTTDLPTGYEAYYSTDDEDSWSKDIPKKKGPGSYTVKVKYVSESGNYEDIQLDDIPVTITVDKSVLGNVIQEATEYKKEITNKNTGGIYDSVISTLEPAISAAETAYNDTEIQKDDIVSAIDALTTALKKAKADVKEIDDQRAADAVIQKINAISDTITGTDKEKEAIKDALAAYDTLTADQKNKVTNLEKLTNAENAWVTAYKNAKKIAADELVNEEDSEAANALVNNAKNDIDNITYDQSKGLDVFKAAVDAIITKVTEDVEDQRAADKVIKQINELPVADKVTIDDKNDIEAARAAYNALTDGQKSKVTDETLKKLTDAEDALAAAIVSDTINALPDKNQVKTEDKNAIEAARAAYNALTDGQKSKVTDEILKKLTDAEAALKDLVDAAEAKKVADMIDKLPSSDKVALTDKESIKAARKAYDALTDDQKEKVDPETLKKLTDDEDRLKILQAMSEVSAKTGSGMTYTGKPIQLINTPTTKLPAGYKMVYAVTSENKAPTDEKLYTTEIPTKTEVGTYYVWYKVVGNENYIDTEPACVKVTIAEEKKQDEPETPAKTVDMYRLYNPNSGEHFYTASAGEKDFLVNVGWTFEGVGWKAPATSNTPVYRVYNPNAGDHHYTTNKAERDNLISLGWKDEGIGWYSDDAQSLPIFRQYNPNAVSGAHNFTSSKGENDWLISVGWSGEGIGWYGVK